MIKEKIIEIIRKENDITNPIRNIVRLQIIKKKNNKFQKIQSFVINVAKQDIWLKIVMLKKESENQIYLKH